MIQTTSTLQELLYWAKIRWWIEQNYQQLKDELGLDHFEGRSWAGWHHHVTLTMMAFAFLVLEGFRAKKNYRLIRFTQVTTTYRICGYGRLPHEFNGI